MGEPNMKKLQILGTGCAKCRQLTERTEEAAKELGLGYEIEKVTDLIEITKFNVMMTPALVVDGTIKCSGRVPSIPELKTMLS
jgi:small redox-active disulfide protein 2